MRGSPLEDKRKDEIQGKGTEKLTTRRSVSPQRPPGPVPSQVDYHCPFFLARGWEPGHRESDVAELFSPRQAGLSAALFTKPESLQILVTSSSCVVSF